MICKAKLWETNTSCTGNCTLDLDGDGNLCLHQWNAATGGTWKATDKWNTGTFGNNMGYLLFQNAPPYLQMLSDHGALLWTDTGVIQFEHNVLGGVYVEGSAEAADVVIYASNPWATKYDWAVYDYRLTLVENGTSLPNSSNIAVIKPKSRKKGFYDVTVGGFNTSFAIVGDNSWAYHKGHPFGVCTHFSEGVSSDLIPLIVKLGAKPIRDNGGLWARVEKEEGVFNFSQDAAWMSAVQKAELEPTLIGGLSNPIYTW